MDKVGEGGNITGNREGGMERGAVSKPFFISHDGGGNRTQSDPGTGEYE